MKVVFLGCHCDDIELGCGATINKNRNNWEIYCYTFSNSSSFNSLNHLSDISKKSLEILGCKNSYYFNFETNNFWKKRQEIWENIKSIEEEISPDMVFTHFKDEHQDHEVIYKETIRNFSNKNIFLYRPSMSYISEFNVNYIEKISADDLSNKIKAVGLYKDYIHKPYCIPKNIEAQCRVIGIKSGIELSEGFEIYRILSQ